MSWSKKINSKTAVYSNLKCEVSGVSKYLCDSKTLRYIAFPDYKNVKVILVPMDCGDFSYRYFLGRITEEVSRADRFNLEVSCLMISLDQAGFEGLLEMARLLKEQCRQYDIPARWGQNELVMLLPATDLDGAQTFAERFRIKVEYAANGGHGCGSRVHKRSQGYGRSYGR